MKTIIIFIMLLLPLSLSATETICHYPESVETTSKKVQLEREIFRKDGYFIIIDFYAIEGHPHENTLNKFHFENIKKLAIKHWEYPKDLSVNDYFDEDGNPTPYVLLEIGAFLIDNTLYDAQEKIVIGTCIDRQEKNSPNIKAIDAGYYDDILESIKYAFIPLLNIYMNE